MWTKDTDPNTDLYRIQIRVTKKQRIRLDPDMDPQHWLWSWMVKCSPSTSWSVRRADLPRFGPDRGVAAGHQGKDHHETVLVIKDRCPLPLLRRGPIDRVLQVLQEDGPPSLRHLTKRRLHNPSFAKLVICPNQCCGSGSGSYLLTYLVLRYVFDV